MAKPAKPLPAIAWLEPRVQLTRAVSLACFAALAALLLIWNLIFADLHGARTWVVLAIELVPLALLAPGMLAGNPRTHAWCCFVVNLYFIQGVLGAFDPNRMLYGWLQSILSVTLFCVALMYTRYRFQYDRKLGGE
ncbi:DUF2069 domain-containing protein [Pseudomonas sp. N040]|uniref:DUF2069 domain-containing protein n=1 Tax=Pseudomonas sp. N040 TaxID=2785325 RepID=UPI0018A2BDCD|nr:DUF2069 domain-containing protein [Pseudomonas sp. N040]MBF7729388.1 DUF2069 domain-containing protein [Pseudomonas sp. N040]MBW7013028.1 DUF2069 domain-containing protein [Pseudomonas sp. N040]